MAEQDEQAALRAYLQRRLPQAQREQRFGLWLGALIITITMAVVTFALTTSGAIEDELWIGMMLLSIALFINVLLHTLSVIFDSKLGRRWLRRNLTARYRAERALLGAKVSAPFDDSAEKPKRERYRLSDDGEIVPDYEIDDEDERSAARQERSG